MTKLGAYPSDRYSRSWITQRLANRAPPESHIRKNPVSIGQQLFNPIALDIQDTIQQLTSERFNMALSSADVTLLDALYRLDLAPGMEFSYTYNGIGEKVYTPPTVYATISGTEYEITQAQNNDLRTLAYYCLPSRIEDGETAYSYEEVIPRTLVSNLSSLTPNTMYLYSHLYVTVRDNTNWEVQFNNKKYYPKVYITGTTRKGTTVTEAIPIRHNGTFRTINEWKSVTSVFVSYLDDTAYVTIETFPFDREDLLDSRNIMVPPTGGERIQFATLEAQSFGTTFVVQSYTVSNMDMVRSGIDEKETVYEIELLDESGNNINANDMILRENTKFMYVIDDSNFYVYNTELEFPDVSNMTGESSDTKMDLYSDRWIFARGEVATIKTRNLISTEPPWQNRWTLLDPDGDTYYMGLDGSLWPTTTDAWITNDKWEYGVWDEQWVDLTLTKNGVYIITLECSYYSNITNLTSTLTTKYLFYVPSMRPEIQFALPSALLNSDNIGIDSDGQVWMYKYNSVNLLNLFYDYFLVDYEQNRVWFKEEYASARVVL